MNRPSARAFPALAGLALGALPGAARACAVCLSGSDDSRMAFILTTVFMTAMPLAMIGSAVFWLRRRVLRIQRQEAGSDPQRGR